MSAKPETKPFYKTSEFWGIVIANLINLMGALQGVIKPEVATVITAVLNSAYAIARGLSKSGSEYKPDDEPTK